MVALIPARSGSKGIPGKNTVLVHGRPLIDYTIAAAKKARHIHRIVVSTDSPEIQKLAMDLGAEAPFLRPFELAGDHSLAFDTFVDAIQRIETLGERIPSICVLQPTSPLRKAEDIDKAIELFEQKLADSVISVCKAPHPRSWFKVLGTDGVLRSAQAEPIRSTNRQEEQTYYVPNGAVYVLRTEFFLQAKGFYSERTHGFVMPQERSIDIDTPFDLRIAEMLLAGLNHQL